MTDHTTRLSIAIISRDDAHGLRETLNSVCDMADELVVTDTGSMDTSRSVARDAGARVFEFSWCDDFSSARNACASNATGDWILWLDTGETLSAADIAELKQFVLTKADPSKAYALVVQVAPNAPNAGAEQIARVRLVPNQTALKFEARVRETMDTAIAAAGLTVEGLPYRIHRGIREHEPFRKAERARRNIRLADLQIKDTQPTANMLNCMGDAFQVLGDDDRARQLFGHALKASAPNSVDMLEAYYGLLTSLDGDENRQLQLDTAVQASEVFPMDAQLLCALGGYLQGIGRTDLAGQSYHTALRYGQINPYVWHVAEVRQIAVICYSIALQMQGKLDEAEQLLAEAYGSEEGSLRVLRHLIELQVKQGKRDEALENVRRMPKETPHRDALRSAVRGACLAVKQNWIAAKAYLKTAYAAGCRDTICLRWYAITLLSTGETSEAKNVLDQWQSVEPQNAEVLKLLEALTPSADTPADVRAESAKQFRFDGPKPSTGVFPTSTAAHDSQSARE